MDYDRDGKLDLFVSNYMVFDLEYDTAGGCNPDCNYKGIPINCGPRGLQPEQVPSSITTTVMGLSPR